MQTIQAIEKLENDGEYAQDVNMLKKLSTVKHKDILRETVLEMLRKGNYVCIYPARGSEVYDQYFAQVRPLNRFLNKVLFQDETIEKIQVPASGNTLEDTPESKNNKMNGERGSQGKLKGKNEGVNFKNIKD